jgi:hypothetical protein
LFPVISANSGLHHVDQVALVPNGEVLGIALVLRRVHVVALPPLVLRILPLVEGLIDHEEAEPVAQCVQLRGVRVVGHPDGVTADLTQRQ